MDALTLQRAMTRPGYTMPYVRALQLVDGANESMRMAGCTTRLRACHYLSQLGHESVSLQATEEFASGEEYEWRADLGNTQAGDGVRFKGRSFIQITGRANYAAFSQWAYARHLVPTPTYFVDHPTELANDRWAWIGAVWYWTGKHERNTTQWQFCNDAADHNDIQGLTYLINGAQNGLADRQTRFNLAWSLGNAVLPTPVESPQSNNQGEITMAKLDAEDHAWLQAALDATALRIGGFLTTGNTNAVFNPKIPGRAWVGDPRCITLNDVQKSLSLGLYGDAPDDRLPAGTGETHAAWSNEAIYKQNQQILQLLQGLAKNATPA